MLISEFGTEGVTNSILIDVTQKENNKKNYFVKFATLITFLKKMDY